MVLLKLAVGEIVEESIAVELVGAILAGPSNRATGAKVVKRQRTYGNEFFWTESSEGVSTPSATQLLVSLFQRKHLYVLFVSLATWIWRSIPPEILVTFNEPALEVLESNS